MTILGVSSVAPEVMQATARAASAFVEIDALVEKTGELVSRYTGAEDSYITSVRLGGYCHCRRCRYHPRRSGARRPDAGQ
ncbi:transferase [Salmonella enterica subsp. enterica]|nr:transferase [Salmonella enterica subsp. enterica]